MTLSIEIPDLEKLTARFRAMPEELRLEQRKLVSAAAGVVKDEAQQMIHSPGGHARKGIKVKVSGAGLSIRARVVPANRAAIFAQRSRRPGQTPPPMRSALAMARRYGIPKERARALALAIARKGTQGHPVMHAALAARRNQVENMFVDAIYSVARKLGS